MSQRGVSERVSFLRRRIAALEAREGAAAAPRVSMAEKAAGFLAPLLSARGSLSEILPARPPDAPAATVFALALARAARRARGGGALLFIVEDLAAREFGLPYGRGLAAAGTDLAHVALIRARRPRETLAAMEEALKSGACAAVVAESFLDARLYDLAASRRLLLAARRGGALGVLAPLGAPALSSAAELRVEIAAPPPPLARAFSARPPLAPEAPFLWRLRVAKARAGLLGPPGEIDPAHWRDIAFDPEQAAFHHAFPERLPAETVDRPAAAPPERRSA